jgi:ribonuclease BN (tRNA processing enzyme)
MGQDTAGGNEAGERGPNGENIRKTKDSKTPIDIYGPEGLRLWLRTAIRYSVSRIVPKYRVHELKDVAMAPEWGYSPKWEKYFFNKAAFYERKNADDPNKRNNVNVNSRNNGAANEYYWGAANHKRRQSLSDPRMRGQSSDWLSLCEQGAPMIEPSELYGEVEGGRDIYPIFDHPQSSDGAPVWEVEHEGGGDGDEKSSSGDGDDVNSGVRVYAAPMSHGVPCVGYVVQEANRPGRLRDELVKPICQRNIPALKAAGFRHPMKALAVIKDLPEGGSFTFPDGTVVTQEEAVEPTRPGRKVVICGDTNSARSLEKLAENADVVVHEATNTFLHALDRNDSNFNSVTKEAIFHGHSTPHIAGDFAKRVKAKRLILNHFSARYMGDQSIESISIMTRIEQQAMKASGLTRSDVAAAWDFMIFPIPKAYQKKASSLNSSDGEGDNEVETTA